MFKFLLDFIINLIGGEQYINIFTAIISATAAGIIAFATWRYTNYSKRNIEVLEEQKGIMLANLLKKEGKDIRNMIVDLAVYDNVVTLLKNLGSVDEDKKAWIKDEHAKCIDNLQNIIQNFRTIDLLLKKQDDKDIILTLYQDLFGFSEYENRKYFEIIKTSLQNHSINFNKNDLDLVKNIFKFIAERGNFVELLKDIKK